MDIGYDDAVLVASVSEEYGYIAMHPCPACGGHWKVRMQALLKDAGGRHYDRVDVVCRQCRRTQAFVFDVGSVLPSASD